MSLLLDYLALLRLRYHLPFSTVVVTAFVFGTLPPAVTALRLVALFFSFCLCLYGALYTINGIADRKLDAIHPRKKDRPLAAGRISPQAAWIFVVLLLITAFTTAWLWFGPRVLALYVLFVTVNLVYSYVIKRIPYVEIVGNAITHPLRMLLGVAIGAGTILPLLVSAYFFLSIGFSAMRRVLEKENGEKAGRPVLRLYTLHDLRLVNVIVSVALLLHLFVAWPVENGWFVMFFVAHVIVAFIAPESRVVRWVVGS